MKNYEGMFLVDTKELKKGAGAIEAQINALIEKSRGKVVRSEKWDERKLAYEIKGATNGTYFLFYFTGDSETVKLLKRECELSSLILRALFLNLRSIPEPRSPDWRREREDGGDSRPESRSKSDEDSDADSEEESSSDGKDERE